MITNCKQKMSSSETQYAENACKIDFNISNTAQYLKLSLLRITVSYQTEKKLNSQLLHLHVEKREARGINQKLCIYANLIREKSIFFFREKFLFARKTFLTLIKCSKHTLKGQKMSSFFKAVDTFKNLIIIKRTGGRLSL